MLLIADEDAARAAIDASGKAPQNVPEADYTAALTELTIGVSVDAQAAGLLTEQAREKQTCACANYLRVVLCQEFREMMLIRC